MSRKAATSFAMQNIAGDRLRWKELKTTATEPNRSVENVTKNGKRVVGAPTPTKEEGYR